MNSTLKYIVFWDDKQIGEIYSNNMDEYKYLPDCPEIEKLGAAPMAILGTPQLTWGKLPVFFAERIARDPECETGCRCATDKIIIKKEKS